MTKLSIMQGDRITVSATHQVKIDGLDAWIKLEVNAQAQPNETADEAFDRINGLVADRIIGVIENQASVIVDANAKQR